MKTHTHLHRLAAEAEELSHRQRMLELLAARRLAEDKRRAVKSTFSPEWNVFYMAGAYTEDCLRNLIQVMGGLQS